MGQKVHPIGFRVGITRNWDSRWFAQGKTYARFLHEDDRIRVLIKKRLYHAGIASVIIERPAPKSVKIVIFAARPGVVIGKKGAEVELLKSELAQKTGRDIHVEIVEVRNPETNAQLIAESLAQQLERRVAFRRAMKRALINATKFEVGGIKIRCAGRLGGAELSRAEWYREGRVPLQTLRATIDYGYTRALTTYGVIGVQVWVFEPDAGMRKREAAQR